MKEELELRPDLSNAMNSYGEYELSWQLATGKTHGRAPEVSKLRYDLWVKLAEEIIAENTVFQLPDHCQKQREGWIIAEKLTNYHKTGI